MRRNTKVASLVGGSIREDRWYDGLAESDGTEGDLLIERLSGSKPTNGIEGVREILTGDPDYTCHPRKSHDGSTEAWTNSAINWELWN